MMATKNPTKKPCPAEPDWAEIEAAYRSGVSSLRKIAGEHSITEGAIRKRAKKESWVRDLSERISQRADDLVRMEAVRSEVRNSSRVPDREIIEANAELQANVVRGERRDITRYRGLVAKLFAELEVTTDNVELMEQLGELMTTPGEAGIDKINELYRKVVSLPGRVDMAKKLVETLEKLINSERRVFNIKDEDGDGVKRFINEIRLVPLMRTIEHET